MCKVLGPILSTLYIKFRVFGISNFNFMQVSSREHWPIVIIADRQGKTGVGSHISPLRGTRVEGPENSQRMLSDFFSDDVTEETFTDDPSKLPLCLFAVIVETEGLREVSAQRKIKTARTLF